MVIQIYEIEYKSIKDEDLFFTYLNEFLQEHLESYKLGWDFSKI